MKVSFPVAVSDTAATYGVPYGSLRRSTQRRTTWEQARVEVPAERWADITQAGYGISLLTADKYGFDITGSRIRLSLLRAPLWPDPTADRGRHETRYALFPHRGRPEDGNTVQRAYELTTPLLCIATGRHAGPLGLATAFIALAPANVILTSVKKDEDTDAMVVQWFETSGTETAARLTLPAPPRRAVMSDFLEQDGPPIPSTGKILTVPTPARGVVTVKVAF